ncbi:MAG TPA: ABC transporter permease [Gallionella sp.]|nr:ABC transporter permease [Gallionella sp.]
MTNASPSLAHAPHHGRVLQPASAFISRAAAHVGTRAVGLLLPLAVLYLWQTAVDREWVAIQLLPPAELVWQSLRDLWQSGDLTSNLAVSLSRIGWSVLIGSAIGWLLGFLIGLSRTARAYLYPSFEVFSQFPVIGWIPLLIIFLGIDEALKIAAISMAVIVPVTVATFKGIENIPTRLLEVARVYCFTPRQLLLRVVLPAALPSLFSGFRQGIMQAWLTLVFVELLASSEGIGYLMVWGRQLMQLDLVFVGLIVIGVVGLILDLSLRRLEACLQDWRHDNKQEQK